jgi:formylglycine-generating enzyme required for sulfatase activity
MIAPLKTRRVSSCHDVDRRAWPAWRSLASSLVVGMLALLIAACVSSPRGSGGAAESRQPGSTFRECVDCPDMVVVPGGRFTIGSATSEPGRGDEEGPQREVTIGAFALGRTDVTRGQWAAFAAATNRPTVGGCAWAGPLGHRLDPSKSWRAVDFEQDDTHPVVCVSWGDAQAYTRWLGERTGHAYRLPSEAEWEYAARAGTTTAFPWGDVATHDRANYGAETCCSGLASGADRWVATSPAGAFPVNAFGLADMHGNVLQWVQDCLSTDYRALPSDGRSFERAAPLPASEFLLPGMEGRNACEFRMLRGGDWGDPPAMIRSAFRNYGPPDGATIDNYRSAGAGFRVARSL